MQKAESGRYHPRRMEKDLPDRAEQLAVIRSQKFLTFAVCRDNEPYLVTMNYAFSEAENCFYLHCANEGKKMDFIRANPRVWGQVVEDRGYVQGKCSHAYRSVMFDGVAEVVHEPEAKRRALELMIEQFEPDPEPLKAKLLTKAGMEKTTVLRLRVLAMSGKQSPAPGKG